MPYSEQIDDFFHIKGKSDSSEAILVFLDQSAFSKRLFSGFEVFHRKQNILAKDVIVMQNTQANILRALDMVDSVVAALTLRVDDLMLSDGCIEAANLSYDSSTGLLPNLDLFSCTSKILEIQRINRKVRHSHQGCRVLGWLLRRFERMKEDSLLTKYLQLFIIGIK